MYFRKVCYLRVNQDISKYSYTLLMVVISEIYKDKGEYHNIDIMLLFVICDLIVQIKSDRYMCVNSKAFSPRPNRRLAALQASV